MKMKTGKRLASFFLSACIALSVLFGAVVFAAADTVPTSESVSELSAVYTYAEGAEVGTIAVNAKAQNIGDEEYVMFYVYQNVNDISDPTNGKQNAPVTSKGFYASDILSGEALAKELSLTPLKLNGKCVLGVQVTNRGDENDWVYAYITTALKLNPNGGTLTGEDELQVKLGFSILEELGDGEYVTREYYKFAGWSETEDGEAIGSDLLMTQYGDEIFALWEQLTTTVTFNPNGGEGEMDPVVINAGEPTELPAPEFTKPDSKFVGWGTSPDGPVVYDGTEPITLTGDEAELPLYAIWADVDKYVVTFDANGGEGEMADQEVEIGVATALNANEFNRAGFKFQGWATSAEGEVVYADGEEVTLTDSGLKLYAVWKQNNIAVIYSPNGGTGLMTPHKLNVNETINLDKVAYVCEGKAFAGWSTSADGEVEYADEAEFTIGAKTVILYAIWTDDSGPEDPPVDPDPKPKAILFSTGGGYGLMNPIKNLSKGQVVKLPACEYTKEGYTFGGWSLTSGGAVAYNDCDSVTIGDSTIVLYAVWVA
ncbi:MAG: InlB B-repeat-containing protein [Clostridia bacterium]|nr:InlB B-repeat-containing protein [Clostridia bacterium]